MNLSSKCLHSWFLSNFILSFQTNLGKTMVSPFRTTYKLKFWFWSLKSTVTVHTPRGAILSPEYVLRLLSVYNVYLNILSVYLVPTWLSSAGNRNSFLTFFILPVILGANVMYLPNTESTQQGGCKLFKKQTRNKHIMLKTQACNLLQSRVLHIGYYFWPKLRGRHFLFLNFVTFCRCLNGK